MKLVSTAGSYILWLCLQKTEGWHCEYRQDADVEARRAAEEMDQKERASEIRREERARKIKFMKDMDDNTEVRRLTWRRAVTTLPR